MMRGEAQNSVKEKKNDGCTRFCANVRALIRYSRKVNVDVWNEPNAFWEGSITDVQCLSHVSQLMRTVVIN